MQEAITAITHPISPVVTIGSIFQRSMLLLHTRPKQVEASGTFSFQFTIALLVTGTNDSLRICGCRTKDSWLNRVSVWRELSFWRGKNERNPRQIVVRSCEVFFREFRVCDSRACALVLCLFWCFDDAWRQQEKVRDFVIRSVGHRDTSECEPVRACLCTTHSKERESSTTYITFKSP